MLLGLLFDGPRAHAVEAPSVITWVWMHSLTNQVKKMKFATTPLSILMKIGNLSELVPKITKMKSVFQNSNQRGRFGPPKFRHFWKPPFVKTSITWALFIIHRDMGVASL